LPVVRVGAKVRPFTIDDLRQIWLTEKLILQNLSGWNAIKRFRCRDPKGLIISAADDNHPSPRLGNAVIGRVDDMGARNSIAPNEGRKRAMEVVAKTREARDVLH
jgi:hypothetical protein